MPKKVKIIVRLFVIAIFGFLGTCWYQDYQYTHNYERDVSHHGDKKWQQN